MNNNGKALQKKLANKNNGLKTTLVANIIFFAFGCSSSKPEVGQKSDQQADFYNQRAALIAKHSATDNVFAALAAQAETDKSAGEDYWKWRIDQYLYGQYPEYQPIYDAYTKDKSFNQIYDMPPEDLGPAAIIPTNLPALPDGFFSENLPGNPQTGWHYVAGDMLYITYQGHLTDPYIASYNLKNHQWQGPYKAAHSTLSKGDRKIDSHGRPILEVDSKGHLHIAYGGHGGEREDGLNPMSIDTPHAGGRMLHVMSEKPHDISSFVYVDDISPFASYTKSYKMANGDIYLFTRAGTHKSPWVYYKMKNGEQRFQPPVIITWPTAQQDNPIYVDTFYINPLKVSDTDIAISYLWHECNFLEYHDNTHYSRINSYYMRLDTNTDTFYNAQYETLDLPITIDDANNKMLAFDSTNREETPFTTKPLILEDNAPALAYEARIKDFREWRMARYQDGKWLHSQPMPGTVDRNLWDKNNHNIDNIVNLTRLGDSSTSRSAIVIYIDYKGKSHLAEATSNNGQDWQVRKTHLALENTRIQMEPVVDNSGNTIAIVVALKNGEAQRLYLWHHGEFRAPQSTASAISEALLTGI